MTADERTLFVESLREGNAKVAILLEQLLDEHSLLEQEHFLDEQPPLPPPPVIIAGDLVGSYRLLSQIGEGGMGSVWLAERSDGRFERRAAVKFLTVSLARRGSEQRFKLEGSILGRLSHANIAELLDAGVFNGRPYLVLEYVDGEHIDEYCENRQLSVDARVRLIIDVLGGLAHAHANLVVHRDIKPSNVLVRDDGQVKLLDFGIAKLLEDEEQAGARMALTREAGAVLTPAYAAPEQLTGSPVTTATDVYASGVLLYLLLTGKHPAGEAARSPAELIQAIVHTEPPPASQTVNRVGNKLRHDWDRDLDTIVAKALKKNPQERYVSAAAFAADLQRYLRHEPIAARRDAFGYRTAKFVRRNRTAVALTALAFAASLAGLFGTLIQARTARTQRDFALRQLSRAEAVDDLNSFVLSDAAPSGKPFTVDGLLTRAREIVQRQPDASLSRAELLIAIGSQYKVQDEYAKARPLLEQAYREATNLGDTSAGARAACALAQTLSRQGEPERAEELFRNGLRMVSAQPMFANDRVDCLLDGSQIAQNGGDAQAGISRAMAAMQVLNAAPYRSELQELQAQMVLASAHTHAGRYAEADAAFEQVAVRLAALGRDQTQTAGTVFNNWGVSLILAGRPLEAERVLRRSMSVSRDGQSNIAVQPQLLVNYGRVLYDLGRLDEAAEFAGRGYAKAEQAGDDAPATQSLLLQAAIDREKGNVNEAAAALAQAEPRLSKNLPSGHIAFGVLALQQALNAEALGQWHEAEALADRAVAIAEALGKARRQGADYLPRFLERRSEIELHARRPEQAQADASRALSLFRQNAPGATSSSIAGRAYLALGRALQAQGKHREAQNAFHSAATQLENALGPDHPDTRSALRLASESSPKGN